MTGFKEFIMRGNVVDLAIAVIIGAAFTGIVDSMTRDIITPIIGLIGGQPDFSSFKVGSIGIGNFINAIISFFIKALVVYYAVVKPFGMLLNKLNSSKKEKELALPTDIELLTEIRDLLKKSKE